MDRFVLRTPLGEGAFGRVWQAEDRESGACVVVKIAHARHCEPGALGVVHDRFRAEFDAVSRVDHPNVVKMLACGQTPDARPALAMTHAPGQSMARILERRAPLPMKFLWPVIEQVVSALGAAHAVDVIHRDVSPDNILVAPRRQSVHVSLVDFGVARLDGLGQHTVGPIGTPGYMAPEQILGEPLPASDMFSVGALLWWALTGKEWLGDGQSMRAMLLRQVEMAEVPDPRDLRPVLDPRLSDLVRSLLQPVPQQRPTAVAFLGQWRAMWKQLAPRGRTDTMAAVHRTSPGMRPLRQTLPDLPTSRAVTTTGANHQRPRLDVLDGQRLLADAPARLAESLDPRRTPALRMAALRTVAALARRAGAAELAAAASLTANALPRLQSEELSRRVTALERQLAELRPRAAT